MPLWRIVPVAGPHDPRWFDGPVFEEVIVRAPLASAARVAAAEMEARLHPYDPIRNHATREALHFPSSFYDEKLYHVEEIDPATAPDGPDGVIGHRVRTPERR